MAKLSRVQTSFNNGELSPRLHGHVDIEKYASSLKLCQNFIPLKHGPLTKRGGTIFVDETKDLDEVRFEEFEFNEAQTYAILFGPLYARFYSGGGRVDNPPGTPVEIVTPYLESELYELRFTQTNDFLIITHRNHPPAAIKRTSPNTFVYEVLEIIDGPFEESLKVHPNQMEIVALGGGQFQFQASGAGFTPFAVTDIGRLLRFTDNGTTWRSFKLNNFINSTTMNGAIQETDPGEVASPQGGADFRLGAWAGLNSYPSACSFHQQRLFFGGGDNDLSQRIDASVVGDFFKFSPTPLNDSLIGDEPTDDSSLSYQVASDQVNIISWLKSAKSMVVGTTNAEFRLGSAEDGALTPGTVTVSRESRHGTANVEPEYMGNAVVYAQRAGIKLREMLFDFQSDSFASNDLTLFGDHLTRGKIKQLAFQQEPDTVCWIVTENGDLLSLTYDREQTVFAWAKHILGGADVKVISVASVSSDDQRDEVWFVVERTIDGVTKRYVEYLSKEFDLQPGIDDAFFVDSGLVYNGAPVTTITGLDHLEGETVSILADGAVHPDRVVASGQITLQKSVEKAAVGLPYVSKAITLTSEQGLPDGSSQGRKMRTHALNFRVFRSLGFKAGVLKPDGTEDLEIVPLRSSDDAMDAAPGLLSDVREVKARSGWDRSAEILIVSDQPVPLMVLNMVQRFSVNEP